MKAVAAGILVSIFLPGACSTDRGAGGTAETENAVVARIFRVDSLLSDWNRPTLVPTVATLRLDSHDFDFANADPTGRDLDIRRMDGRSVPFEILQWDPAAKHGRLHARIETDLLVPGARLALWRGLARSDRSDPVGVWKNLPDSQRIALTSVLVDDFESGTSRTLLPDSSSWFLGTGTGTGIVVPGNSGSGHALRLVSTSTGSTSVSLAAALLASTPRSLRSIDSIVFWARVQGQARAAMEHAVAGTQLVAWSALPPDTTWRRIRLVPGAFDTGASTSRGASWSAVRDSVTHLSFWMVGAGELWIDDPRIFGIDRDDLR